MAHGHKSVETDCRCGDSDPIESVLTDVCYEPGKFIPWRMGREA